MIVLDVSAALELLLRAADRPGLVTRILRSGESIATSPTCPVFEWPSR